MKVNIFWRLLALLWRLAASIKVEAILRHGYANLRQQL
jgi:hypothetical protein